MEVCSTVHPEGVGGLAVLVDLVDLVDGVPAFLEVQQKQEAFLMALKLGEVNQWVVVPYPLPPLVGAWHC